MNRLLSSWVSGPGFRIFEFSGKSYVAIFNEAPFKIRVN